MPPPRASSVTTLYITRLPPDGDGPGGMQRSMQVLRALARRGPVDMVVLGRAGDAEATREPSAEALALVDNYRQIPVPGWAPSWQRWPWLPWKLQQVWEFCTLGPADAPRLSRADLAAIAKALPATRYALLFAERLSSAWIANQLISRGLLQADRRAVDFDDVISRFKQRELDLSGTSEGRLRRWLMQRTIAALDRAERQLCRSWDAVGVPLAEDLAGFSGPTTQARLALLPNVVDRPRLDDAGRDPATILFVGHLGYPPNLHGLQAFLQQAWPRLRAAEPGLRLQVVGMYPAPETIALVRDAGGELHANVPSVMPFYETAGLVIAPIFYGSGTRIKIIEALAYGRPVVSTGAGAEGLGLIDGESALIADTMPAFADAVLRLVRQPDLARDLAEAGYRAYSLRFSPAALDTGIAQMLDANAG